MRRRTTRRTAVKAGAALAVGAGAAGYVKPALKGLGIPAALALSGTSGGPSGGGGPQPACNLNVRVTNATAALTYVSGGDYNASVSGTIEVTESAGGVGCCTVHCVTVYVLDQYGFDGCAPPVLTACSPFAGFVGTTPSGQPVYVTDFLQGNTGGSNPIIAGTTCLPSSTPSYSFVFPTPISVDNEEPAAQVVVALAVIDPVTAQTYQYCAGALIS